MRNEDDDDAFHHNWQKFSGMDNEKFDHYISVDSHLATSGVNTVEELCASHVQTQRAAGEKRKGKILNPNPKLCRTFAKALTKVKSFVCARSNSDGDRDSVLSLESSFLELRRKVSAKQLSITEFLQKN
jgi:hypothetical protein